MAWATVTPNSLRVERQMMSKFTHKERESKTKDTHGHAIIVPRVGISTVVNTKTTNNLSYLLLGVLLIQQTPNIWAIVRATPSCSGRNKAGSTADEARRTVLSSVERAFIWPMILLSNLITAILFMVR